MQRRNYPMTKAFICLAIISLLAACAPAPVTAPPAGPVTPLPDICKSAPYHSLIGQPAAAVAAAGIAAPTRVIPLGGFITEDYSTSRINFYLDAAGMISKITCG